MPLMPFGAYGCTTEKRFGHNRKLMLNAIDKNVSNETRLIFLIIE